MPGPHLDSFSEVSNYIISCFPSFNQAIRRRAGSIFAPSEEGRYPLSSFAHELHEGCCMITHNKVWINRASCQSCSWSVQKKMDTSLPAFAPENLVSRDDLGRPVPRQPLHSPYSGRIWCLLTGFLPISAVASIYLFHPPLSVGSVPSLSGRAIAYRWRSLPRVRRHRASKRQGSSSNGCFLCITIDQPICASFSHAHY